jgi:hypothetical protein
MGWALCKMLGVNTVNRIADMASDLTAWRTVKICMARF